LRDRLQKFTASWKSWGIDADSAFKRSFKGSLAFARQNRLEVETDEEQHEVACLSTIGLIGFLQGAQVVLKSRVMRSDALALLRAFLARALPPTVLEDIGPRSTPACAMRACAGSLAGALCEHLHLAFKAFDGPGKPTAARACDGLLAVHSFGPVCPAASEWAKELVQRVSKAVASRVEAIAYTSDPLKASCLDEGRGRKRPIDEDVKSAVLERVPREARADSSYKYLKSRQDYDPKRAYPWQDDCLLKYQSSAWLSSAAPRTVSIACDAKRLGCPAEDVEVFGAVVRTAQGEGHFVWLPPQAPLRAKTNENTGKQAKTRGRTRCIPRKKNVRKQSANNRKQ